MATKWMIKKAAPKKVVKKNEVKKIQAEINIPEGKPSRRMSRKYSEAE